MSSLLPNLKKARKEADLTQEELATKVGVTPKTYRSWEKTEASPDCEKLKILADGLNVSADYLLGRIKERLLDVHYVCDITGLSEDAITNLISMDADEKWSASDIISSKHFADLISSFTSLKQLMCVADDLFCIVDEGWNTESSLKDLEKIDEAIDELSCDFERNLMGFKYSVIESLERIINENLQVDDCIRDIRSLKKDFDEKALTQRMSDLYRKGGG